MAEKTEKSAEKAAEAAKIVRNHMFGSVASGILPIPLIDIGILTAIQLRMVKRLADHYDVKFSEQRARAIIGSLAGLGLAATAGGVLRMIVPGAAKALLGIGQLTVPAATTYAPGQVFIEHFESGGTIWTFDAKRAKKTDDDELVAGQKVVEKSYAGVKP